MYKTIASWPVRFMAVFSLLICFEVSAGVVVTGTRVVYPANEREVTVKITNPAEIPSLVQVWADRGDEESLPDTADAPFLIMPPIFRLDPEKAQSVRVTFTGADLPQNTESVFWLNVLDVPPLPKGEQAPANFVQIAFRSRIKIFYRPVGLSGKVTEAPGKLVWSLKPVVGKSGYALHAENPSAYHVTVNRALLKAQGREFEAEGGMVPPGKSLDFPLKDLKSSSSLSGELKLRFDSINDYGAVETYDAPVRQ